MKNEKRNFIGRCLQQADAVLDADSDTIVPTRLLLEIPRTACRSDPQQLR